MAKAVPTAPWYESTLFWGAFGATIAGVLPVMVKGPRWLLALAWPFACIAIYVGFEGIKSPLFRWTTDAAVSLVVGVLLCWLNSFLKQQGSSFVYVVPDGQIHNSTSWQFSLKPHGPEHLFNIQMFFSEMAPQLSNRGLTTKEIRRSTLSLIWAELDAGTKITGPPTSFTYSPLVPDHGHFFITVSYRGGNIIEDLFIERVADKWAYAIRAGIPGEGTVFECRDSGFPGRYSGRALKPCKL